MSRSTAATIRPRQKTASIFALCTRTLRPTSPAAPSRLATTTTPTTNSTLSAETGPTPFRPAGSTSFATASSRRHHLRRWRLSGLRRLEPDQLPLQYRHQRFCRLWSGKQHSPGPYRQGDPGPGQRQRLHRCSPDYLRWRVRLPELSQRLPPEYQRYILLQWLQLRSRRGLISQFGQRKPEHSLQGA